MDRCDTPTTIFLFTSDGRPFFACDEHYACYPAVKMLRRRVAGCSLERRSGNYAAATLDELRRWGPENLDLVWDQGDPRLILYKPYDSEVSVGL